MRLAKVIIRRNIQQLAAVAALLLLCACGEKQAEYPRREIPEGFINVRAQENAGQALFLDKCAVCHGKPSEGRSSRANFFQPPAPDFTDIHYRDINPAYLYWRIEQGKTVEPYRSQGSVMPAWGAYFSTEQIWQIVAYLKHRAH